MEKCMLPVCGKPIIRIIIEKILKSEAFKPEDIIISVLEKNVLNFKHEFRDLGIDVRGIPESPSTANHYEYVSDHLDLSHSDGDVMVHYGDNIADINYGFMCVEYALAKDNNIPFLVAATRLVKYDYSLIKYKSKVNSALELIIAGKHASNSFNMATEFVEKPYVPDPSWMGILMAPDSAIRNEIRWVRGKSGVVNVDFGFDVLPNLAKDNRLAVYLYDGEWWDVGNTAAYLKLIKRAEAGQFKI
jgi:NDP-sugar pyrophosphorylase family protein